MDKMIIEGGVALRGELRVSGAKNSALKLLFATLLAQGKFRFRNVPRLRDVESARGLLRSLGSESEWQGDELIVDSQISASHRADYELVRKMRASILCLGPMLTRFGDAIVSLPGGCAIGTRPIDMHLQGLQAMGAEIELQEGYVRAHAQRLKGAHFLFDIATVGGTENLMMAATLADGKTTLENAAKEPEIIELAEFLNAMGARITGQGTSVIQIEGVTSLRPADWTVMPDRIEAGTLLVAAAISGGELTLKDARADHLEALLLKLGEAGFPVTHERDQIHICGAREWLATDISTHPYPQFPTDLQAQMMALATLAKGTSVFTENIFENRFMHVPELLRMGADITPRSKVAVVRGISELRGAPVMATDLRASACLVLAGLVAQGTTTVSRIYHLDRGYEGLEKKLSKLGARIQRISDGNAHE